MEGRPPDLSARLGEALQGLKEAKRRREGQRQRRDARIRGERQGDPGRGEGRPPKVGLALTRGQGTRARGRQEGTPAPGVRVQRPLIPVNQQSHATMCWSPTGGGQSGRGQG